MISFIIPCYNSRNTILQTIESILSQNIPDIEIIIVDDGSTDDTKYIVKNYIDTHSSDDIKYFYKKNGGAASARNYGLEHAKNKYIQFVDADDRITEIYYTVLKKYIDEDIYDIMYYDSWLKFDEGKLEYYKNYNEYAENEVTNFIIQSFSPCFFLVKREYLEKNNFSFIENIIYEDYASIPYLGVTDGKLKYVNQGLYCYSKIGNSVMRVKNNCFQENYLDIVPASKNLLPLLKTEYCDEIKYLIMQHLLIYGVQRIDNSSGDKWVKKKAKNDIIKFYKQNVVGFRKTIYYKKFSLKQKMLYFLYSMNLSSVLCLYGKLINKLRRCL